MSIFRKISKWFKKKQKSGEQAVSNVVKTVSSGASNVGKAISSSVAKQRKNAVENLKDENKAKWGDAFNPKTNSVRSAFKTAIKNSSPVKDWKDWNKQGGYKGSGGYSKKAQDVSQSATFEAKRHPYAYSAANGAAKGTSVGLFDLVESQQDAKHKQQTALTDKYVSKAPGAKALGVGTEIAGNIASFGTGMGATNKLAESFLAKHAGNAEKAAAALSKTSVIRKAAERAAEKAGIPAEELASRYATRLVNGLAKDAAMNATLGTAQAATQSFSSDKTVKEQGKDFLANEALNVGLGAGIEAVPYAARAIKNKGADEDVLSLLRKQQSIRDNADEYLGTANKYKQLNSKVELPTKDADAAAPAAETVKNPTTAARNTVEDVTVQPLKNAAENADTAATEAKSTADNIGALKQRHQELSDEMLRTSASKDTAGFAAASNERKVIGSKLKSAGEDTGALQENYVTPADIKDVKSGAAATEPTDTAVMPKAELPDKRAVKAVPPIGNEANDIMSDLANGEHQVVKPNGEKSSWEMLDDVNENRKFYQDAHGNDTRKLNGADAVDEPAEQTTKLDQVNRDFESPRNYDNMRSQDENDTLGVKPLDKQGATYTDTALAEDSRLRQQAKYDPNEVRVGETTTTSATVSNRESTRKSLKDSVDNANTGFAVRSFKQEKAAAVESVMDNPKQVAYSLSETLDSGDFNFKDIFKADALRAYSERYGYSDGAALANEFITCYGNTVGRLWGAYGSIQTFGRLSAQSKIKVMQRQLTRLCVDSGIEDTEAFLKQIDFDNGMQRILDATTDAEEKAAKKALVNGAQKAIPKTALDILNEWRYLAMLGNPKTHIRNMVGNFVFATVRLASDTMSAAIQKSMLNSGKIEYATRASMSTADLAKMSNIDNSFGAVINQYVKEDMDDLMGNSEKYLASVEHGMDNTDKKKFEGVISWLSEKNGELLNYEDEIGIKFNYRKSFYQFLKANNFGTGEQRLSDDKMIAKAREFAGQDALVATFRDYNSIANWLNNVRFAGTKKNASLPQRVGGFVETAVLPFTNTPANVMKQAKNLSPVGLLEGISQMRRAGTTDAFNAATDRLCNGLTGTAIMALGAWLGSREADDDSSFLPFSVSLITQADTSDPIQKYKKGLGYQDYSIVFKHGKDSTSYTLDWLTPISSVLFMGAEFSKQAAMLSQGQGVFDTISGIAETTGRLLDPLFQTTMLSGISNVLEGASNDSKSSVVTNALGSIAQNYVSSFNPTILGQLSRTIAPYAYDLTSDAATTGGQSMGYFANQQISKIPGLSKKVLAPKVDMYGNIVDEKKSSKDYAKSAVENFISPSYRQKITKTKTDEKLIKLYNDLVANGMDAQTAKQVLPDIDYKFDKVISSTDGKERKYGLKREEMHMTRAERAKYLENRSKTGQERLANLMFNNAAFNASGARATQTEKQAMQNATGHSMKSALATLVNSRQYKAAAPEDRKSMILEVLGITKSRNNTALKELYINRGNSEADYYVKANLSAGKQAAIRDQGLDKILTNEQIMDFAESASKNKYSDSESTNGQLFKNFNKSSMLAYLNSDAAKDLTSEQKAALYNLFKRSNAKSYGSSGSGKGYHKRRKHYSSGGSSKTKTAKIKASKFKATKQSYKSATSGNSFASKKSSVDLQMSASQQAALRKLLKNNQKGE